MKMIRENDLDIIYKAGTSDKAIIVLHGYGASCNDLAPIGQMMDQSGHFHWYFLDAPLSVDIGYGMEGRAWFPIDMMGLQQALMKGSFRSFFADKIPDGFMEASEKVEALLKSLKEKHSSLILGGFSQGSMISSEVAFKNPGLVDKLFILSGTFVSESHWRDLLSHGTSLPIFQSHGSVDPVLPVSEARRLKEFLEENDQNHEYHEFHGGHEIPLPVIQSLSAFLVRA